MEDLWCSVNLATRSAFSKFVNLCSVHSCGFSVMVSFDEKRCFFDERCYLYLSVYLTIRLGEGKWWSNEVLVECGKRFPKDIWNKGMPWHIIIWITPKTNLIKFDFIRIIYYHLSEDLLARNRNDSKTATSWAPTPASQLRWQLTRVNHLENKA